MEDEQEIYRSRDTNNNCVKKTPKSKAKRDQEEDNVPSKEGPNKIKKTLLEEFNKEAIIIHQRMYQRPLNLGKKFLQRQS